MFFIDLVAVLINHRLANYVKASISYASHFSGSASNHTRLATTSYLSQIGNINIPDSIASTCIGILHLLTGFIVARDESLAARTKACFILGKLRYLEWVYGCCIEYDI
jgi:hypothetical protein